jgi:hypothetical protein
LLGHTRTRRRHYGHCATYGSPVNDTLESTHYGGQSTNRYTTTLEAAPVRAQDAPRRLNRGRIRQDGRQLRGTARHASARRETVRHACKLLPPWPIKGGAVCNDPNFRERKPDSLHLRDSPRKRLSRAIPVSSGTNPYNTGIKEEIHNIIITTSEYNSSAQAGYKSNRTKSRKVKHLRSGST